MVTEQLYSSLKDVFDLDREETERAVRAGFAALDDVTERIRKQGREILTWCAKNEKPCVLVLARPYHMDTGIGHEIEAEIQACGYPILWLQYLPADMDLMNWLFEEDLKSKRIKSPFDIADVWTSSYSSNTNEIMWGAKVATRCPWITCVVRLSSYECGMDQPTYTPAQKIVEATGTLYFKFGDLDSTKPAGGIKIRVETITHYLAKYSQEIIRRKLSYLSPNCPLADVSHYAVPVESERREWQGGKDQRGVDQHDQIDKFSYEYTKKHRITQGAVVMVASLGAGAIVMLTKSKSHWLYIDYHEQNVPKSVVLRMDKNGYKKIFEAVKAHTGKDVEFLGDAKETDKTKKDQKLEGSKDRG